MSGSMGAECRARGLSCTTLGSVNARTQWPHKTCVVTARLMRCCPSGPRHTGAMAGATARRRLSRRAFLAGAGVATVAAGGLVVDQGVLPGRSLLHGHLGLDGPDGVVPQVDGGRTVSGSFVSRARRGRRCGWSIATPPSYGSDAASSLPVAVVLHGHGGDHTKAFDDGYLGLDRFLAQAVGEGATPFAMASVDGGNTYWHRRADGEDAGAMVVDELLPLLAERGLDVRRLAFLGWSMGGYGALRLGGLLGRDRVTAASAMSPALWHRFADTAPGAFDHAADFAGVTVFGRQRQLDVGAGPDRLRRERPVLRGRPGLRRGLPGPPGRWLPARQARRRLLAPDCAAPRPVHRRRVRGRRTQLAGDGPDMARPGPLVVGPGRAPTSSRR